MGGDLPLAYTRSIISGVRERNSAGIRRLSPSSFPSCCIDSKRAGQRPRSQSMHDMICTCESKERTEVVPQHYRRVSRSPGLARRLTYPDSRKRRHYVRERSQRPGVHFLFGNGGSSDPARRADADMFKHIEAPYPATCPLHRHRTPPVSGHQQVLTGSANPRKVSWPYPGRGCATVIAISRIELKSSG
jgi:hypothetical protein